MSTYYYDNQALILAHWRGRWKVSPGDTVPRSPWVPQRLPFDADDPNAGESGWSFPAGGPWVRVQVFQPVSHRLYLGEDSTVEDRGTISIEIHGPKDEAAGGFRALSVLAAAAIAVFVDSAAGFPVEIFAAGNAWKVVTEDAQISGEYENAADDQINISVPWSAEHNVPPPAPE